MRSSRKLTLILGTLLVGAVALGAYVVFWLTYNPATITASKTVNASGQVSSNLLIATTGSINFGTHPSWVAYLIRHDGKWVSSTVWQVPAHSLIHVTVDEYDGPSGLRNNFYSMVRGTIGGVEYYNGKPVTYLNPNLIAHSFAIPALGVNVPLPGIPQTNYPTDLENPHNFHETITFSFRTGAPETVSWQCFVPCAAGYLFGTGGPMQTIGYMDGYLKIVA